jgi:hypothetical protein
MKDIARDEQTISAHEGPVRIQQKCLVSINVFPEIKLQGLVISKTDYANFHVHVSVSD